MNDRPTAEELLEAVQRFLQDDVVPALDGPRKYHARVAANVVGIVAREIAGEEAHLRAEWQRLGELLGESAPVPAERALLREGVRRRTGALVERIRAGDADGGPWRDRVLRHLRQTVDDKLAVARPAASRAAS